MKQILAFFVFMSLLNVSYAEKHPLQDNVEIFFEFLVQDPEKAMSRLFEGSDWIKENKGTLNQVVSEIKVLEDRAGTYYGYEELVTRKLGERYMYKQYMAYFHLSPVVVQLKFYKPNKQWLILGISMHTDLADLMEESADYAVISRIKEDSGDKK